jgi:hypothetical protein
MATNPDRGSVSYRHNNPGNIKYGDFARRYGAQPGEPATDGGVFAMFPDSEVGKRAMADLLRGSSYRDLPLEAAMRRYSGGGYGADIDPSLGNKTMGALTPDEMSRLIDSMIQREGWVPPTGVTAPAPVGNMATTPTTPDPFGQLLYNVGPYAGAPPERVIVRTPEEFAAVRAQGKIPFPMFDMPSIPEETFTPTDTSGMQRGISDFYDAQIAAAQRQAQGARDLNVAARNQLIGQLGPELLRVFFPDSGPSNLPGAQQNANDAFRQMLLEQTRADVATKIFGGERQRDIQKLLFDVAGQDRTRQQEINRFNARARLENRIREMQPYQDFAKMAEERAKLIEQRAYSEWLRQRAQDDAIRKEIAEGEAKRLGRVDQMTGGPLNAFQASYQPLQGLFAQLLTKQAAMSNAGELPDGFLGIGNQRKPAKQQAFREMNETLRQIWDYRADLVTDIQRMNEDPDVTPEERNQALQIYRELTDLFSKLPTTVDITKVDLDDIPEEDQDKVQKWLTDNMQTIMRHAGPAGEMAMLLEELPEEQKQEFQNLLRSGVDPNAIVTVFKLLKGQNTVTPEQADAQAREKARQTIADPTKRWSAIDAEVDSFFQGSVNH